MTMKIQSILVACSLVISLAACKNDEESNATSQYFFSWKIDGVEFQADTTIANPEAVYYTNAFPTPLVIDGYTKTLSVHINLLEESSYLGTFGFGDQDNNNNLHYALISYGPDGNPADYNDDSWFANGVKDSGGTITITEYDMTNHRITGTFEGSFYNSYDDTYKDVTDGSFFLPLSTNNN